MKVIQNIITKVMQNSKKTNTIYKRHRVCMYWELFNKTYWHFYKLIM